MLNTARGSTRSHLRELQTSEWLDYDMALMRQRVQLCDLLRHAAVHVPYYGDLFRATGLVNASGMIDIDRFGSLPLLDKNTVRRRLSDLTSDDLGRRVWKYNSTGGSTGDPVRLVHDRTVQDWGRALGLFGDALVGRGPEDRRLVLWGSVRDLEAGRETLKARVNQWLRHESRINSFRMTHERMPRYVDVINAFRPEHIVAYVESAFELARFIERRGLCVHAPRSVGTSAGTLQPHMRETIQRVFRTAVFETYGSREVAAMALECDCHQGLHVSMPTVYLELLRKDGSAAEAGEVGEIVVTSLANYAMPLIRYRIGDTGSWAPRPCSCGRGWPLLESVTGRVSDSFVTSDGGIVPGEYFCYVFYLQDWVEMYQVIQETTSHIHLRVVLRDDMPDILAACERGQEEIVRKARLVLGVDCDVTFEFVDEIEPTASGKHRYTISKVVVE